MLRRCFFTSSGVSSSNFCDVHVPTILCPDASYSTTGAALLVSAPGGDDEYISNLVVAKYGGGCVSYAEICLFFQPLVVFVSHHFVS